MELQIVIMVEEICAKDESNPKQILALNSFGLNVNQNLLSALESIYVLGFKDYWKEFKAKPKFFKILKSFYKL